MEVFNIILYIIGMAWISNLLAWRLEFEAWLWLKENYLTMRLLNCSTCLSFWITFITSVIITHDVLQSLIISSVTSVVAALMEQKLCTLK